MCREQAREHLGKQLLQLLVFFIIEDLCHSKRGSYLRISSMNKNIKKILNSFQKWFKTGEKMAENAGLVGSGGVWEPLEGACGASWSQGGAQERQEELQEGR